MEKSLIDMVLDNNWVEVKESIETKIANMIMARIDDKKREIVSNINDKLRID